MQIVAETDSLRKQILQWRREEQSIAFVPTMGDIHQGHLALIREATSQADIVIVSIFTNLPKRDLIDEIDSAAGILERDITTLKEQGVSLVFTPSFEAILQTNLEQHIYLEVPNFNNTLFEADSLHPKYLQAFTTAICKLFHLVQPDLVFIGENNIQRLTVINKLVDDLYFPVKIISVPTVRDIDGLVVSRRNRKLTVDERQRATVLSKTLRWASGQLRGGRRDFNELQLDCKDQLRAAGLDPDEIIIRDAATLQSVQEKSEKILICASIKLTHTRLIDNLIIDITTQTPKTTEEEE